MYLSRASEGAMKMIYLESLTYGAGTVQTGEEKVLISTRKYL